MSHALPDRMHSTDPHWETPAPTAPRRHRTAAIWELVAVAAAASGLTAIIVASCLGGGLTRRDLNEASTVENVAGAPSSTTETTGAKMSAPSASARPTPPSTAPEAGPPLFYDPNNQGWNPALPH